MILSETTVLLFPSLAAWNYHPKSLADLAAASSNACFGSLVPEQTWSNACDTCSSIYANCGMLGLLRPNGTSEIISL